jgi:hypothetical protein
MALVPTMEEDVSTGRTAFGVHIIPGSRNATLAQRQVRFAAQCIEVRSHPYAADRRLCPPHPIVHIHLAMPTTRVLYRLGHAHDSHALCTAAH